MYYVEEDIRPCGGFEYILYKMNDDDVDSLIEFCDRVVYMRKQSAWNEQFSKGESDEPKV